MKRFLFIFIIYFLSTPAFAQEPSALPPGWRFPGPEDYYGGWEIYRKMVPEPFHVRADFNGDGFPDDAWMLLREEGPGWGLFVFLGRAGGEPEVVQLAESRMGDAQFRALQAAPPGHYKIMDEAGKRLDIILDLPCLNLFFYGGANLFFYWDTGGFRRTRVLAWPKA